MFGVCCWHFARSRNVELFRPAAKVALIVLVPVSCANLWFGSHFGILVTSLQPMKISASEAQWNTCTHCPFSLFQIGGFTASDPTPSFSIEIPGMLSYLATGSFSGKVTGLNELNNQYRAMYGPGNYEPPIEAIYWSMRGMAYAGSLVALVSIIGAFLFWKRRLERLKWFLWLGVVDDRAPVHRLRVRLVPDGDRPAAVDRAGAAEDGERELARGEHDVARDQPHASSSRCTLVLLVLDVWLMRRFADRDPAESGGEHGSTTPAIGY